ncbi:MAG TPA: MFS transporter, partial [Chloroflexota bacterium]
MLEASSRRWRSLRWRIRRRLRRGVPAWQRNQIALLATVFVTSVGFTAVMPFLPLYVRDLGVQRFDEAAFWSGLLFAVSPLLSGLCAPFWIARAGHHGYKAMLVRALVAVGVCAGLMALVGNVYELLVLRVLLGALGGVGAMAVPVAAASAPRERVSEAVGLMQSAQVLSFAVGPAIGGLVADQLGLRNSFFFMAGLTGVALVVVSALFREEKGVAPRPSVPRSESARRGTLGTPSVRAFLVAIFLAQFVEASFGPILPLYVAALGTPSESVASSTGLILSAGAVTSAIAASVAGRMAVRTPPWRILRIALPVGTLVVLPIALAQAPWHLLALRALLGLVAGSTPTLIYAMANQTLT